MGSGIEDVRGYVEGCKELEVTPLTVDDDLAHGQIRAVRAVAVEEKYKALLVNLPDQAVEVVVWAADPLGMFPVGCGVRGIGAHLRQSLSPLWRILFSSLNACACGFVHTFFCVCHALFPCFTPWSNSLQFTIPPPWNESRFLLTFMKMMVSFHFLNYPSLRPTYHFLVDLAS